MIAISYRRQDSSPVAGRLYDRLQAEFGKGNVFMDFDSIPYGVDFREHIKQTLQRAKVVVAIIGPEWTGGKDPASRRIDDPTDFVRLEVASALENGIPVIPVLVNNTPMPDAKNLPAELEGLAFRNGLALDTGIDFHHHADRLITGIRRVIDPAKEAASVTVPLKASPAAAPPKRSALLPILITLVAIAGIASWYFLGRTPQKVTRQNTKPVAVRSETPTATSSIPPQAIPPASPSVSSAPEDTASTMNEIGREHVFAGKIGAKEATFRLRVQQGGHVIGSYTQSGVTYRIEGRHPFGKMLLDEFTGERLTAHIDVTMIDSPTEFRWEGTMHNTPPDNRVFPVWFARPRK